MKFRNLSPSDILITNLAMTDLLHGFAFMTFFPINRLYTVWPYSKYTCLSIIGFSYVSITVQLNTLVFLSIERYYKLKAQIGQGSAWNKKITYIFVICAWLVFPAIIIAASITSPATQGDDCHPEYYYLKGFSYTIPPRFIITVILLTIFYAKIIKIFLKSKQNIMPHNRSQRQQLKTQLRITKMIAILVGVFFILYFPILLLVFIRVTGLASYSDGLMPAAAIINDINYWINPMIYAWRDKKFRNALKTLFSYCKVRPFAQESTVTTNLSAL